MAKNNGDGNKPEWPALNHPNFVLFLIVASICIMCSAIWIVLVALVRMSQNLGWL